MKPTPFGTGVDWIMRYQSSLWVTPSMIWMKETT